MRELVLAFLIMHLAACSSMQTLRVEDLQTREDNRPLQIGDRVELLTRNKEKLEFAVTDITEEGLAGKFGFIPYEDIKRLRVHRPGQRKDGNLAWLWGLLGVAALAGLVAASDSVTVCSGTPCPPTGSNEQ